MKNRLSYVAVSYFLSRAFFIGIVFSLFIRTSKTDSWLSFLISFGIGFLFLFLIQYIASYEPEKSLREKYILLFPKVYPLMIGLSCLLFFFLACIGFWNLSNLLTSQFLNKTPKFVIQLSFLVPLILLLKKDTKIIARVSLILFYISIFLFLFSLIGLIFQFQFSHFLPAFQANITKPISSLSLFLVIVMIVGVLGIELSLVYQYPEFHILKRAYENILTYRLENILAIQWLFDIFIFCAVSLKGCHELFAIKTGIKEYFLPILMFLISTHLFKDNTIANAFVEKYLSTSIPSICIFIILLFVFKIWIKKRRISPTYLKTESIKQP